MLLRLGETGGHVGSNLAIIEATVALHYIFDVPTDKIIFDVSNQCYTHKRMIFFLSVTLLRQSASLVDWQKDRM